MFPCAYGSQVSTGAYLGYRILNSSSVTAPESPPTEDRHRATFIMLIAPRDCLFSQKRSEPSEHSYRTSPKIMRIFPHVAIFMMKIDLWLYTVEGNFVTMAR